MKVTVATLYRSSNAEHYVTVFSGILEKKQRMDLALKHGLECTDEDRDAIFFVELDLIEFGQKRIPAPNLAFHGGIEATLDGLEEIKPV